MTDELLDAVQPRGRMDLIRDYALPIPTTVISEMLGVPVRRPPQVSSLVERDRDDGAEPVGDTQGDSCRSSFFLRYIRRLVKLRRAAPQDDLVSALVAAHDAGDRLTRGRAAGDGFAAFDCGA